MRRANPVGNSRRAGGALVLTGGGLAIGALLAGLWALFVIFAIVAVTTPAVVSRPWAQRRLAEHARRRERLARREHREMLLEEACVPRDALNELDDVVERIEREDDGRFAERFELAELLDAYAALAVGRQRLVRMTQAANRAEISEALERLSHSNAPADAIRRDCLERRLRLWDSCRAQADRSAAEMEAISEFVRMLGDRAQVPDGLVPSLQPELERRLEDLGCVEASARELTAG